MSQKVFRFPIVRVREVKLRQNNRYSVRGVSGEMVVCLLEDLYYGAPALNF